MKKLTRPEALDLLARGGEVKQINNFAGCAHGPYRLTRQLILEKLKAGRWSPGFLEAGAGPFAEHAPAGTHPNNFFRE